MKIVKYLAVFAAVAVIQTTFCQLISIRGVQPDLVLCFLLYLATKEGALAGVYGGFTMGLLFDVYSPQTLGVGSFAKTVIGYLAGFLDQRNITLDEKFKLPVIFIAAVLHDVITSSLIFSLESTFHGLLLTHILPAAAYTTFVGGLFLLFSYGRR